MEGSGCWKDFKEALRVTTRLRWMQKSLAKVRQKRHASRDLECAIFELPEKETEWYHIIAYSKTEQYCIVQVIVVAGKEKDLFKKRSGDLLLQNRRCRSFILQNRWNLREVLKCERQTFVLFGLMNNIVALLDCKMFLYSLWGSPVMFGIVLAYINVTKIALLQKKRIQHFYSMLGISTYYIL